MPQLLPLAVILWCGSRSARLRLFKGARSFAVWLFLFIGTTASAAEPTGITSRAGAAPVSTPVPLRREPLHPPSSATASTHLFERLSPQAVGIELVHQLPPNPTLEILQDQRSGSGVCIGDYDGDGLPDIYMTHYNRGNRLYRNLGRWRFEDVTASARVGGEGRWCGGATFVDINNDGSLDLFVAVFNGANLLYVNKGDGSFEEQSARYGLAFSGASVMGAFADYDRDGLLDLYLVTSRLALGPSSRLPSSSKAAFQRGAIRVVPPGKLVVSPAYRELFAVMEKGPGRSELIIAGQADSLYRGTRSNRFELVNATAGINGNHIGLAATWWDYNADGYPDLYVSNDYKGPDQLLRNLGNGMFTDVTSQLLPCVPWSSMGTDVADINNDGRLDFIATDMAGSTYSRRVLNYSDPEKDRWFMVTAEPQQYRRNTLFLNSGADRFFEIAHLAGVDSTDWTWSPKFGDLDNDGWVDLFISNGMSRDFINRDLLQDPSMNRWAERPVLRETNFAFRNTGDLRFENVTEEWGLKDETASYGAAYGDLDRDGDLDLVVTNFEEPVAVYRNNSQTGRRILVRLHGTVSNKWGIGAKVQIRTVLGEQTQYLTLARGFMSANEPLLHFGLGTAATIDRLTVQWPNGGVQSFEHLDSGYQYHIVEDPGSPKHADDHDPTAPLFQRNESLSAIRHAENDFDDFARDPLLPWKLSRFGPGMAWGDVDQDGDEDLFVGGAAGQSAILALREPAGNFRASIQTAFETDKSSEDMGGLFFDADGNGTLDLCVISGGSEFPAGDSHLSPRLYLNDGEGLLRRAGEDVFPAIRTAGSAIAAADFDRDGDLDLFLGSRFGEYPLPAPSYLLRNNSGVFSDLTSELAPELRDAGMVTSALWTDVDTDGWLDLIIAPEWGPIRLFKNLNGKFKNISMAAGFAGHSGWWNAIAGGDLNGDGHIDYVASNLGWNSKYRASAKEPALLFFGEFGKGRGRQLLQAEHNAGRIVPVRGKAVMESILPTIAELYPTFASFASASLHDLLPGDALNAATRFEANTFASGAWMNNGRGEFTFVPFPTLAQTAPGYGVAITDVDADGNADVYMVQNFSHTEPETGRLNGGLSILLSGNGDGTFRSVWPSDSGLVVPGDGRSLTVTDLNSDHRPDFVVGVNDGPVIAFQNQISNGNRSAAVHLLGKRGNPQAIGARVTLRLSNGAVQSSEVYAGGGYLSQSSATLRFGLGASNRIEEIKVRWPDGAVTRHTQGFDSPVIRINRDNAVQTEP